MIVARDIAHAKIKERLDAGEADARVHARDHAVYYAGPAKTPAGLRVGLVWADHCRAGWTAYVEQFQAAGGSHGDAGQGQPQSQAGDRLV